MQNYSHSLQTIQLSTVSSQETKLLEQKLGQLQAQLRSLPMQTNGEYRFSLATTQRFAQEVVTDIVFWLNTTGRNENA